MDEDWKIRVLLDSDGVIIGTHEQYVNGHKEIDDEDYVQDFNSFLSFDTTLFHDHTGSFQVK